MERLGGMALAGMGRTGGSVVEDDGSFAFFGFTLP